MDCKFWGPGAWKLLHLIAASNASKIHIQTFFKLLPFVLPCKFCRYSITQFYDEIPIPSSPPWQPWLYKIHCKVNDKLRKQGQKIPPDPSLKEVEEQYSSALILGKESQETPPAFPAWNFLFSLADNHPLSPEVRKSVPMPEIVVASSRPMQGSSVRASPSLDAPTGKINNVQANKYNVLSPQERLKYLKEFFGILKEVLPFQEWRDAFKAAETPTLKLSSRAPGPCGVLSFGLRPHLNSRQKALQWLWSIRCSLEKEIQPGFKNMCRKVSAARSGCGKNRRAKTCRRNRQNGGSNTRRVNLVSIKKSPNPEKKLRATFQNKTTNRLFSRDFGAAGMSNFTRHKNTKRKSRYILRHKSRENWTDPTTPGALSRYILWGKPTLSASIADYKRRFGFKN